MNKIRAIKELNKKEIEQGISPNASWHVDYRDTAYIYFGGLPYELSEGDVLAIFSQFGEPVFLKLARDPETGKSRGFGWLKYEDQRSTDLAVDNLGGAAIAGGRIISVDHARYKPRDDEDPDEGRVGWADLQRRAAAAEGAEAGMREAGSATDTEEEVRRARPMLKEERELELLVEAHDDDDPMKEFLIEKKKEEVAEALRRGNKRIERDKRHKSSGGGGEGGRHHRSHRSRREGSGDEEERRRRRRRRDEDAERSRRDRTPVKKDDDDDRKESRRRDSRDRGSRRDHDRRRSRDRHDDRDRRREPESDRPRRDREDSRDYDKHRHRDSHRSRWDPSRSP